MKFHLDNNDKRVVMGHTLYRQVADENFTVYGKVIQEGDKGGWSEDNECSWIQSGHIFAGVKVINSFIESTAIVKSGIIENSKIAGIVDGNVTNSCIDVTSIASGIVKDSVLKSSRVDGKVYGSTLTHSCINGIVRDSVLESCVVFKGTVQDSYMYICNIDTDGIVSLHAQLCNIKCPINLCFNVKNLDIDDEAFIITRNNESALWCNGKWYGSDLVFNNRLREIFKK